MFHLYRHLLLDSMIHLQSALVIAASLRAHQPGDTWHLEFWITHAEHPITPRLIDGDAVDNQAGLRHFDRQRSHHHDDM